MLSEVADQHVEHRGVRRRVITYIAAARTAAAKTGPSYSIGEVVEGLPSS